MKCSLIAIFSVIYNVLLIQGQNTEQKTAIDYPLNSEITKALNFNSILEDINNFYSHKDEQPEIVSNPNVKAQLFTNNAEADNGNNNTENNNADVSTDANNKNGNTGGNDNGNANTTGNANGNVNTTGNGNGNANGNGSADGNGNASTDNNKEGDNNKDDEKEPQKIGDDDEEEPAKEGGCGSDRASLGMFGFHRPIKKSILVINSNFTIIWFYNNILEGYEYNYPQNDITFKLYYEEDANPNNWANAWKNPVFERTIPLEEVEKGPVIQGVETYQYNWNIIPTTEAGFRQTPKSNQKYKLRIYGDGKDVQSNNANFQCYDDGDIQPGSTNAFYVVDNTQINQKYYMPIRIEDDARMSAKISLLMTFMISILVILYHNW